MCDTSKSVKHVFVATAFFVVLTAIVVTLFKNHLDTLPAATVQINNTVKLPRRASDKCDEIYKNLSKLHLFINGLDTGVRAVGCEDSPATAIFQLDHVQPKELPIEAYQAVWGSILGRPLDTLYTGRHLKYDIRWIRDDQSVAHLAESQPPAMLHIFSWWTPAALMLVLYVWFLLGYLAATTRLLRDDAPAGTELSKCTFSLAKTQMAWWFAIIFASFIFLWIVIGKVPSLSSQALALLGISSATAMASAGISAGQTSTDGVSGRFFEDLLRDGNGITIHRFQMLVMTATLGIMFLFTVATTLTMPEFDASLLTLMGLSATTYVALKIPGLRENAMNSTSQSLESSPGTGGADPKSGYTPTP
ncbi:hypothetical protein EGT07_11325 [Herbaspirillum sp. HC18]|nr:hypothetical protein EGT07_11325 [Herbaspirillum sp. HC18]